MTTAAPEASGSEMARGGVTIAICCYNSAKRLPETLRRLAAQEVPAEIPWEVLVIDNASKDGTAQTATSLWPAVPPAPLRVVHEPHPGLGHARTKAFAEARYGIISFLDDDNWVEKNWIRHLAGFFDSHPEADVVGGPSRAVFETEEPAWFPTVAGMFAVGDPHPEGSEITDQPGTLLWGAGLAVKTKIARQLMSRGFTFVSNGGVLPIRRGDDSELCFALRAMGARFFYDPEMILRHFIPADRATWAKALELSRFMGETSPLLDLYLSALEESPFNAYPSWKRTWTFQYLRTIYRLLKLLALHPVESLRGTEGSPAAVQHASLTGRLAIMPVLLPHYRAIGEQIAHAPWALRKS